MSDPSPTPPLTQRDIFATGEVELSAEDEARLDADPLHRIYDMNKIEAPSILASILGAFTKMVMLQEREDIADYAVEYFERLKVARAADPKIDFDRFMTTQLKERQKELTKSERR